MKTQAITPPTRVTEWSARIRSTSPGRCRAKTAGRTFRARAHPRQSSSCSRRRTTGASRRRCRRRSAPWSRARSSCAPFRNGTAPARGWSSSARARSPRSSRRCRPRRSSMSSPAPAPARRRRPSPAWRQCRTPCDRCLSSCCPSESFRRLQRVYVGLAGPDAYGLIDRGDEDLSVTDLPGLGCCNDGFDGGAHAIGRHRHLDANLGQKVHDVFGAAVDFGVAFLAAIALDLARCHPVHADRDQRIAHVLELERLDDGDDHFHGFVPPVRRLYTISALWPKIKRLV